MRLIPEAAPPLRTASGRAIAVALGALILGFCLFGDCQELRASRIFGSILGEVTAALTDAGTQWMVFICAGVYFLAFLVLRSRLATGALAGRGTTGTRWNASLPEELWLLGLLALATLAYAFDYAQAVKSSMALVLLGGAMLGQGVGFFESRKQKAESRNGEGESRKQKVESRNGEEHSREQKAESRNEGEGTVLALIILLTIAAVWQTEAGRVFQYRGQGRWSGPWDNPNTFGMLMGVGVVLSLGRLVLRKAESRKQKAEILGEYPTSNIEPPTSPVEKAENRKQKAEMGDGGDREDEHPTSNAEHGILNWRLWVGRGFLLGAGGVMGWGLLKSYSRGAWLGTAVALTHLGYEKLKAEMLKTENRRQKGEGSAGKAESGKQKAEISPGLLQWAGRQRVSLAIICASVGLLAFWSFRDTERLVARRAFSVGNVNDFSWRNRVSAYEGSLQMMADKPWLGFGWNQPERAYEQFYRKPQVAEGAAIQLNDYFTLGTALGAPALLCFVVYVGLALIRPLTTDYGPRTTDYGLRTTDSYLKAICRAAAVVLVVAFWFDGGLFKLATAGPFWILLELGKGDLATDYAPLADI